MNSKPHEMKLNNLTITKMPKSLLQNFFIFIFHAFSPPLHIKNLYLKILSFKTYPTPPPSRQRRKEGKIKKKEKEKEKEKEPRSTGGGEE